MESPEQKQDRTVRVCSILLAAHANMEGHDVMMERVRHLEQAIVLLEATCVADQETLRKGLDSIEWQLASLMEACNE